MIRRRIASASLSVLALLASGATPAGAADETRRFIIVNPAGRGDQGLAKGFLANFSSALSASWPRDAGPPPSFEGSYHVTVADALASIRGQEPVLALVTAGFYRDQAESLQLVPLARPVLAGGARPVVHLVAPAEAATVTLGPGSLAGLRLGGQLAGEAEFLLDVVLRPLAAPAAAPPTCVPIARTLEVVRQLRAGAIDLGVLDDADWSRLQRAGRATGLHVAFTSREVPEGPVVAVRAPRAEPLGPDSAVRLEVASAAARAILTFDATAEGRAVLETMGLLKFAPSSPADYADLPAPRRKAPPRQEAAP